jgi:ATP-dependent DNA helicase RecQ
LNTLSNQSNIRPLSLKTLLVYLELHKLIKPSHSYFAEYRFKLCLPEQELLAKFEGERHGFVRALFENSRMARVWGTIDFDALNRAYPCERSRVISALDYMDQQGMIELQTKQMTQVYQVLETDFDIQKVSRKLFERFSTKEHSEIKRIHQLMSFFESDQCLSRQLALYFSDHQAPEQCGHCSVCAGQVARFPLILENPSLDGTDFTELSQEIREKLGEMATPVLISRFLCGLSTPIFSRLKVRSLKGFASLENYRFSEVKNWAEHHFQH